MKCLDLLIVAGQFTFLNGEMFSDFLDHGTYMEFTKAIPQFVRKSDANLVILSGGATKKETSALSEAESMEIILRETKRVEEIKVPLLLDTAATDSAEHLILGCMVAKKNLLEQGQEDVVIRTVSIAAAWKFKNLRFSLNAIGLGISKRFFFYGYRDAGETAVPVPDAILYPNEDSKQAELYLRRSDHEKRKSRWHHPSIPFLSRFTEYEPFFPKVLEALRNLDKHQNQENLMKLQRAFDAEVIMPRSVR